MLRIKRLNESTKLNESKGATATGVRKANLVVYDQNVNAPSSTGTLAPIVAHWLVDSGEFTFSKLEKGTYTVDTNYENTRHKFKINITEVSVNVDDTLLVQVLFKAVE